MATVRAFDRSMIAAYLQRRELPSSTDETGNFFVRFAYTDKLGCAPAIWFVADGETQQIYYLRFESDRHFPPDQWDRIRMVCNIWNEQRRWPKAYLQIEDLDLEDEGEDEGLIYLEEQLDLKSGIHQELFDDFTDTVIAGAMSFWEWVRESSDVSGHAH